MKNIIIVIGLLLVGVSTFAQGKLTDEKRKEFEAQKVAFFTQQLDLSPDEAAVFWPLYNEMQKKMRTLEEGLRKQRGEMCVKKGVKQEEYKKAIEKMLATEKEMQVIKEAYYQKMLTKIPASKIRRLDEAEHKFHSQLCDKLRRESCSKK